MKDDYALVVGISRYPSLGDLDGPEWDARRFATWLADPNGGNVPSDQIDLILSSNYAAGESTADAKPVHDDIVACIDRYVELGQANADHNVGRRLYLYLAGHGMASDTRSAALLMANAADGRMRHFPGAEVATDLCSATLFEEIVLFMDCCRDSHKRGPRMSGFWDELPEAETPARSLYGFASDWAASAYELETGAGKQAEGLFTTALLKGLQGGAARDERGAITAETLEDFVNHFMTSPPYDEIDQEPIFEYNKKRQIDLVESPTLGGDHVD